MSKILHHEILTGSQSVPHHWIFFLHGMFGWGKNWAGIARRVIDARPDWGAILIDLPGHGESQVQDGPPELPSAAIHLQRLVEHLGTKSHAVLGHSFGGKVALQYAMAQPDNLRRIFIIDSTPAAVIIKGEAAEMLRLLKRMSREFTSRDDALEQLCDRGVERNVAKWMIMNLKLHGKLWRWRMDLDSMDLLLLDFQQRDLWKAVEQTTVDLDFVRGRRSRILSPEAVRRIDQAGSLVHLHELDAGHWVHVDRPLELANLITTTLPE